MSTEFRGHPTLYPVPTLCSSTRTCWRRSANTRQYSPGPGSCWHEVSLYPVPTLYSIPGNCCHKESEYPVPTLYSTVYPDLMTLRIPVSRANISVQYTWTGWRWESLYPVPRLQYGLPGPDDTENPVPTLYSTVYLDLMSLRIPVSRANTIVQYTRIWWHWESLFPVPTL